MAERMAAELWIGGMIAESLVPELCAAIDTQGVSLEWGGGPAKLDSREALLDACEKRNGVLLLRLYDDQATWGELEDLELFLREHGIAYTRRSCGRYEYDAVVVEYRPERGLFELTANASLEPVVLASELTSVDAALTRSLEQLQSGAVEKAARSVARALRLLRKQLPPALPPLEPFEIQEIENAEATHGR